MIIHNVFFWLKKEITTEQKSTFKQSLIDLGTINTVTSISIGIPAHSLPERPVTERGFDFSLTLHFNSVAEHNSYQEDHAHHIFITKNSSFWQQVKVYDIDTNI